MEAILRAPFGEVQFIAAADVVSGEVIQLADGQPAVVGGMRGFSAGELATGYSHGSYDLLSASATEFAVGAPVYWDVSANLAIASPGDADDLYMGTAEVAKSSGQTTVRTKLGTPGCGAGSIGMRNLFTTREVEIDHADTAEFPLITANENPNGCLLMQFIGRVTEEPAGSSEDQLIVTLYDDDDNALSTLTTTNTTPDAVGDVIQGTQAANGATGAVLKSIPAGKGAYAKVSQATAGTPAGKLKVRAILCPLI